MANFFALSSASDVGITDGTDTLAINTDGSLIQGNNCLIAGNTTVASNNTQTVYTAPAGGAKVFGINLSCLSGGTPGCYITIAGMRAMHCIGGGAGLVSNNSHSFGENYISLTSGQTVTVTAPASQYAWASVLYKEN